MNEFASMCARDRIPIIWFQDNTGVDVGNDAERAELLGLGQALAYSIQNSGMPSMEVTLRKSTSAVHYVMGGPQGGDNNTFSIGTATSEISVMNGATAATAMYSRKLVREYSAGEDVSDTVAKMNAMMQDYHDKSRPAYIAKLGLLDEIVPLKSLRKYLVAFTEAAYQNPKSICPFQLMLLPRVIRDYDARLPQEEAAHKDASENKLTIAFDAGVQDKRYDWKRRTEAPSGLEWLQRIRKHFPYLVWLNPEPMPSHPDFWGQTHIQLAKLFPMYRLSVQGLETAMKRLMVK